MKNNILLALGMVLLTIFAFSLFFLSPSGKPRSYKNSFILRVRIARDVSLSNVSTDALCNIIKPATGEIIMKGLRLDEGSKLSVSAGKILVGKESFREGVIRISPKDGSGFSFNGTEYRGELDVTVTGDSYRVVNRVEIEDYLKGVVPGEVYSFWPMSALKAQAVASRSYAVFEAFRRKKMAYDLTADTYSQVYGGKSSEKNRTTKAVIATCGEVLKYNGKIIPGYFHASCGGHTTAVSKVWGGADSAPLKGVRSPYCRWSTSFRWRSRVPTEKILEKLKSSGYGLDRIDDLRKGKVDFSGRVEYVRVKARNKWFEVPIRDFMNSVGRATLKSSNFRIRKYPLFYDFDGYGWGHGVGMCQWCTFGLSLRRWNYKRILEFFYPGSVVSEM